MSYRLMKYAYAVGDSIIGYSDKNTVKVAGEINPQGADWYTVTTPVTWCCDGDLFKGDDGEIIARRELEKRMGWNK